MAADDGTQSFWDHLDTLRTVIVQALAISMSLGVVAFCFKDQLFAVVLAPADSDFITYRVLRTVSSLTGDDMTASDVRLINTGVARQLIIHMRTALAAGALCASPYVVYLLFRFVSPALYDNERRYAVRVAGGGYVMFGVGVLVSYFIVFPLTFRFLGTYQVSADVTNMITLDSYMSTLAVMCTALGIVFEIPVVAWLLAKLGLLTARRMRRYRKHAVVAELCAAAVITPTSDIFTLLLVALPMALLYEASILIVTHADTRQ